MNERDVASIFDRANASFEKAGATHQKVAVSTNRADNILARIDQRSGAVKDARRRELKRLNSGIVSTLTGKCIGCGGNACDAESEQQSCNKFLHGISPMGQVKAMV